ncbi:mitochondrial nucleoid-associated protein 1 [Lithobates pipiens]
METCPFCGKAFKRLKSHLPHCKMTTAKNNPNATEQAKKSPKKGTKKALLVEAKEQNLNSEGDDTMEVTKKTQLNKKNQKHLEPSSCRTQKIILEDKEKEHLKKHILNSNLDRANGNNLLIDKEEKRSDQCPIEGPTILTTLQSLEVASSLEPTNPLHVAVTPSQTLALQALPEGSEFSKASEDNWTWPNRKADVRGAIGKSRSAGVKSTVFEEVSKKALLVEGKEQYLKNKILQNPKMTSSLAPTDPLPVAVTPPQTSALQALPGGSEFLKASEDNWTWPNRKADVRGAIGKSRSAGVKSTVFEEASKKALLVEAKEQYLNNEGDDTMEMTKKAQLNKKKHSCQESCRSQQFIHEENERECVKKDIKNNLSHTHGNDHLIDKEENRSDYCPIEGPTILTTLQSLEVASSLEPTDPFHVADTPSQTSALQALPGGSEFSKASEDNWTWPNRKADVRGAIGKSRSAGVKSTVYEEVSKKALLVEAKEQYLNEGDDTMEITKKAQLNKKKHTCQESCRTHQFMDEENEREHIKKDIKNNHLGHTHANDHLIDKEENRFDYCPIEGSTTLTSLWSPEVATSIVHTDPLHAAVTPSQTSALQALQGGFEFLKASENNFTWPNYKGDFRDAIEKTASLGIKLPLYKEVSKVMEDRMQGDDHCSFQNGFKGFNESLFQKPELPSETNSSFLPSTMVFSSHRPHTDFPRHSDYVQLAHISRQLQTYESGALKSMEKSLEGQLDLTPSNETKTPWPVRDVLSRNRSLGLQWIPELHSNYIQLKIVPEQIDLKSSSGRMGKSIAMGPFDPESCRPTQHQSIPEVPLTSRRLMDVRIGDLPSWLVLQRPSMKTIPELGVKAWTRYYNKYINVRKGGIGGLAMLLTGYCVLSYSWNYHHIRQDRWRKYH